MDTQERECLEYVQANGWQVIDCIRDISSGYNLQHPGIEKLRSLLREGSIDAVVSYAIDRLSRNQNQVGVLFDEAEQFDVRMEFVTENFGPEALPEPDYDSCLEFEQEY